MRDLGRRGTPRVLTAVRGLRGSADRVFLTAFGISLACHLVVLGAGLLTLPGKSRKVSARSLEVVYDATERVEDRLARAQRTLARLRGVGTLAAGTPSPRIRIPNREAVVRGGLAPELDPSRGTLLDLSDLLAASHGDPVLLSYFSSIREMIQRTANTGTWLGAEGEDGVVYISFVLEATGALRSVDVVGERSTPSGRLQAIALEIVRRSGPFAPFPPSLGRHSRTVVVPLEFLSGT